MKAILLSSTFLALSSVAAIADPRIPARTPIAAASVFTWTGCYVGAHVGATKAHVSTTTNFEGSGSYGDSGTGTIAGGQVGCNYQQGSWVIGVEGEGSWSNAETTNSMAVSAVDSVSLSTKNTGDFSIAGRAGIAFDRTLIYGKGGWVRSSFDFSSTLNCCFLSPTFKSGSFNVTSFLVGAGIEHALTPNWTAKVEYNYSEFGSKLLNAGVDGGGRPVDVSERSTHHTIKIGVNYLFDFGRTPGRATH